MRDRIKASSKPPFSGSNKVPSATHR
jgi:hypothetical protein